MWHLSSDAKPWFAVKRFGYGAGLPVAWQGWAVLLSYIAALTGFALLAARAQGMTLVGLIVIMVLLTVALVVIIRARTRGPWRWRWGDDT